MNTSLIERAWIVIAVMGVVTILVRSSFVLLFNSVASMPKSMDDALRMVPVAALSALVAPAVFRPDGGFAPFNVRVLAAAIAIAIALRTKNMLLTTVVGLAIVIAAEAMKL